MKNERILLSAIALLAAFATGYMCGKASANTCEAQKTEKLMYTERSGYTTVCVYAESMSAYGHVLKRVVL
jgi:hypothetical protein